jgi:hypothetical protein
MNDLWVCGRIWSGEELVSIMYDGDEEGEIFPWKMVGIFTDRDKAKQACTTREHFLFRMEPDQEMTGIIEIDYPARRPAKI